MTTYADRGDDGSSRSRLGSWWRENRYQVTAFGIGAVALGAAMLLHGVDPNAVRTVVYYVIGGLGAATALLHGGRMAWGALRPSGAARGGSAPEYRP